MCRQRNSEILRGGVSLIDYKPAFSVDGKLLLICTGYRVSVYSVATGLLVGAVKSFGLFDCQLASLSCENSDSEPVFRSFS